MFESFTGASTMGFAWNRKMCIIFSAPTLLSSEFSVSCLRATLMLIGKTCAQFEGIEQFDQIMTEQYYLWEESKWEQVTKNFETEIIKKENVLVGDTIHYLAYTEFKAVA